MIMSLLAVPVSVSRVVSQLLSRVRTLSTAIRVCSFVAMMFFTAAVVAQPGDDLTTPPTPSSIPTAQAVLVSLNEQIPAFTFLVNTIAFVIGIAFVMSGLFRMKHFGEMRTMMSREGSVGAAFLYLFVGAMLIYLPTTITVGTSTFWATTCSYCYPTSQDDPWTQFIGVCYNIVGFVGLIAFIRGLVLLAHANEGGSHQGGLAKALTHIFGGLFCINIQLFMTTLSKTLGV